MPYIKLKDKQHQEDFMAHKKTSPFALAFATVSAAALIGGIYYAQNSDLMTDVEGAERALIGANLKPIHVGGYSAFGCRKSDFFNTQFTAENATGKQISGTVCKTLFGAQTISYQ